MTGRIAALVVVALLGTPSEASGQRQAGPGGCAVPGDTTVVASGGRGKTTIEQEFNETFTLRPRACRQRRMPAARIE